MRTGIANPLRTLVCFRRPPSRRGRSMRPQGPERPGGPTPSMPLRIALGPRGVRSSSWPTRRPRGCGWKISRASSRACPSAGAYPRALQPALPAAPPSEASLGVSVAVGAAAQTGSLLLSSREGRRAQLLPPVHLVWVRARDVHTTLGDALQACREGLPAVLALHSGPSKSADIGQILVTGVHGPGRIIAAILGSDA